VQRFKDSAALTFGGDRAILPALMRRHAAILIALAALAALDGCTNACEDLGARICTCSGGGTATDTCKQQIKNLLSDVGVSSSDKAFCAQRLAACNVPATLVHDPPQNGDAQFCEWINTACGKVACGLAHDTDPPSCAP
jgi:hypothetical protein